MKTKRLLMLLLAFALVLALLTFGAAATGETTVLDEGFEGYVLPTGWSSESDAANFEWTVGVGDYNMSTGAHSGNYNAKITHKSNGCVAYLVTPTMDLTSGYAVLDLWYINREWTGDKDGFGVCWRVGSGEWQELFSTTEAHAAWTELIVTMPAAARTANVQLGFRMTDGYGYGVGVDDVLLLTAESAITQTLHYEANGGSGSMTDVVAAIGDVVIVDQNGFTAPSGMRFWKWNTAADGSGTDYLPGDTIAFTEDVTLYALWSQSVAVTYYANDGTSASYSDQTVTNEIYTILDNPFTAPSGMRFWKWNTAANGSGTVYNSGASVTLTGNLTLYAQWIDAASLDEGFESGTLPSGWSSESGVSGYAWTVKTSYYSSTGPHSGSYNAGITHKSSGAVAYLVTPAMDLSGKSGMLAQLDFWYINSNYSGDIDGFGVAWRVNGGEWQELFSTDEAHETWTEGTVALPPAALTANVQLGFRATDGYGHGVGLDDVALTFAAPGELDVYTIIYNANGGSGTMAATECYEGFTTSVAANGFTAPSGMHFLKWNTAANGSGTSYYPGDSVTLTGNLTLYAQWIDAASLDEGFESGTLPSGWSSESGVSGYAWTVKTSYYSSTGPHSGSYNARITHKTNGAVAYLVTPAMDLSGKSGMLAQLDFWYINSNYSGDIDGFGVAWRVNGGAWQELFSTDEAHEVWTEGIIALPAAAMTANIQIGFRATDHYGNGVGLDDVKLTFTDPGSTLLYTITYDSNGGSGTMAATECYEGFTTSVAANGFTAPSGMRFRKWNTAADGSGTDYNAGDIVALTGDLTLYALWVDAASLDEGFESGVIPEGWTRETENSNANWQVGVGDYNTGTGAHTGSYNARMTYSTNSGYSAWLVTPTLDLSGKSGMLARLDFWYINRAYSDSIDGFGVAWRVNGGAWQELFSTDEAHEVWTEGTLALPAAAMTANVQIGFRATDHYGNGVGLDDMALSFVDPTELDVYTITYNANGGSGTMAATEYYEGFTAFVAANSFTGPDGAPFLRWNTAADGSGTDYDPGDIVALTGDLTLYAQWFDNTGLNEGFEGGVIPPLWTTETDYSVYTWKIGFGDYDTAPGTHSGSYNAYVHNVGSSGNSAALITPTLDLSGLQSGALSFWYEKRAYGVNVDVLTVSYRVDGGEWQDLFSDAEARNEWTRGYVVLPAGVFVNGVQFRFLAVGGASYGLGLDDVETILSANPAPTADMFNVTLPSGYLYMDGSDLNSQITVSLKDGYSGVGTITKRFYLSGVLVDQVDRPGVYTLCIDVDEGAVYGTTLISDPAWTFTVVYDVAACGDWFEDFEGAAPLLGWSLTDSDNDGNGWYVNSGLFNSQTSDTYYQYHSGENVLTSASWVSQVVLTPDNWAITPPILIPTGAKLSFWMYAQDPNYPGDKVAVYVVTDTEGVAVTKIGSDYLAESDGTSHEIDLSAWAGQVVYIAFRHYDCTDFFRVNLDDIAISTHVHGNFTYTASGDTITATCGVSGCSVGEFPLVIKAPAEGERAATLSEHDPAIFPNAVIHYVGRNETVYADTTAVPTRSGDYTASVTVGGVTASVDFTLTITGIAIDETNFPDTVFRTWVLNNFDTVADGILYPEEIEAATEIFEENRSFGSLKGIEFFTELTYLGIGNSPNLTTLDLSHNPKINGIDIWNTGLTSLDVSGLSLSTLCVSYNALQTLTLGSQPDLYLLYCNGNDLDELDITECPNMVNAVLNGTRTSETDNYGNTYYEYSLNMSGWLDVDPDTTLIPSPAAFEITTHPQDASGAIGDTVSFHVEATGQGLTYQWQYKTPTGNWKNSTTDGCTTDTLNVVVSQTRNGYQYHCIVTCGSESLISDPATLTVSTAPVFKITAHPQDASGAIGETVSFHVEASGQGLTYQWQYKTPTGNWKNSTTAGCTTDTLNVVVSQTRNGYQYHCIVTCGSESLTSDPATLTVAVPVFEITSHPQDASAPIGETVTFHVVASGEGLTYQWQYKTPTGNWKNSTTEGCTTDTLNVVVTQTRNNYQYHCIVTCGSESLTSDPATLTVAVPAVTLKITTHPQDASAPIGETVSFHVVATGEGLSYQWQYKTPTGTWKNSTTEGCTTDTLNVVVTQTRNGYQYHCIVKDANGNSLTSDPATLTVAVPVFEITSHPQDASAPIGVTVSFHVEATGVGLTYQWQYKTPTGAWKNSTTASCTTDTLYIVVSQTRNGYQYHCIVTDGNGESLTSDPATLTVAVQSEPFEIKSHPQDASAPIGVTVSFHVEATGQDLTYQWQYKTPTGNWKNSTTAGCTTDTLNVVVSQTRNGYQYHCIVTDGNGETLTSDPATLTVAVPATTFEITQNPQNTYAKAGATVTFTVEAEGEDLSYRWQYKTPSGTWKDSSGTGADTNSLKVTAAAKRNGYQYHCIVTNGNGEELTSDPATLTVFAIAAQPADASGTAGVTVKFTVTAIGDGLTYQWQYKTPSGTWKNCSSATEGYNERELKVVVSQTRNGYQYRCIVTDSTNETLTSAAATLTVE